MAAAPGTAGPPSGVVTMSEPVVVIDSDSAGAAGSSKGIKVGLWIAR